MKRFLPLLVLAPLAAAYLLTTLGDPAHDPDVWLDKQTCWFESQRGWKTTCYRLSVPENRSTEGGRRTAMPVVMLKPKGGTGGPPVLHLMGGPGQPAGITTTEGVADWADYLATLDWSKGRTHIFLDPRGVGALASPHLRCAILSDIRWSLSVDRLGVGTPAWRSKLEGTTRMCRDAFLRAGIDLSAFSTAETARDLVGLRRALGLDRWVLYGVSYGTRLALEVIAQDPDGVAAAILDGLDPPHVASIAQMAPNLQRSLDLLYADCRADDACSEVYPNLEEALPQILQRLRSDPLEMSLRPKKRGALSLQVTEENFLEGLEYALSTTDWLPFIPALIDGFHRGNVGLFAFLAANIVDDPYYDSDANGLALSVWCGSELPVNTPAEFELSRRAAPLLNTLDGETESRFVCGVWLPDAPAEAPLPPAVADDAPTLLLSGAYDTRTPPTYAMSQQQHMPNAHHLIVRDQSHGVSMTSECAQQAMSAFLDGPDVYTPPSCASDQHRPAFITEFPEPARAEPVNR